MKVKEYGNDLQVSADGNKVWVNGPDGCIGRICKVSHELGLAFVTTKPPSWSDFVAHFKKLGIDIPEDFKPLWVR